jgi:cytochrome P450
MVLNRSNLPLIEMSDPGTWLDPRKPLLEALKSSPVARDEQGVLWLLSHAAVTSTLKDRRFGMPNLALMYGALDPVIADWSAQQMGSMNGDEHRRTRGLVARAFTPRTADDQRPFMRETLDALFVEYFRCGDIATLGELPGRVMSKLLGVPPEDFERFIDWVDDLGQFFNFDLANPAVTAQIRSAIQHLDAYIRDLIARRDGGREADLLSQLLAEHEGQRLTQDEVTVLVTNLLFAGTDTVRNSIELFCYLLATHPDQLEILKQNRELIPSAVEELLRFEPTPPFHTRRALEDVEFDGLLIAEGETVMVSLITADRDPQVWDRPDELDIQRVGAPRTQVFGGGSHVCLGAALARAELQEFLGALVDNADRIANNSSPTFPPFHFLRRLQHLDLAIQR